MDKLNKLEPIKEKKRHIRNKTTLETSKVSQEEEAKNKQIDNFLKPINYNGTSIRTFKDIEQLVNYDELNRDMINLANKEIFDSQF